MAEGIPPAQDDRLVRREDPSGALSAAPRRSCSTSSSCSTPTATRKAGTPTAIRTELHERFADKCEPVRTLLQKVNAWKMWVLCDRPAIKNWTQGRITLLGDAAHPMLQYLAQGGNMAMEDAVCLAKQIVASGDDYAAAFKKYQELRYLRTARVQLMARVFGEIYHASGVNRELRNKVLGDWTAQGGVDMSWLYGHQPELPQVEHRPDAGDDAARRSDKNSKSTGRKRRMAKLAELHRRPRDREPHAGQARASSIRSATSASAIRTIRSAISCRARARPSASKRRRHHGVHARRRGGRRQGHASPTPSASSTARAYRGAARRDVGDPQPQPGRHPVRHHRHTRCKPIMHMCATIGHEVPIWDQRTKFGDTDLLVTQHGDGPRSREEARQGPHLR